MSKEALKLALEALEYWDVHGKLHQPTEEAITAIKQALEQPVQEPVATRMPKVGDRVVCIDDESLGTVVYLTAGGSPEIKFDDGSHGTYMLREFAELFGYTTPAQPAPVQDSTCSETLRAQGKAYPRTCRKCGKGPCIGAPKQLPEQPAAVQEPAAWADALFDAIKHGDAEHQNWLQEKLKSWVIVNPPPTPPATQRQWVGLTNDEVRKINQEVRGYVSADHARMRGYAHAIEAKLKEKNT